MREFPQAEAHLHDFIFPAISLRAASPPIDVLRLHLPTPLVYQACHAYSHLAVHSSNVQSNGSDERLAFRIGLLRTTLSLFASFLLPRYRCDVGLNALW